MAAIGYARVRTGEQSAEPQTSVLREAGCDRIFTNHDVKGPGISGLELDSILDHLRPGDELVIWKLDRLGRSTKASYSSSNYCVYSHFHSTSESLI